MDPLPPFPGVARTNRNRAPGEPAPATVPVNLDYFRCLSAVDDKVGRLHAFIPHDPNDPCNSALTWALR